MERANRASTSRPLESDFKKKSPELDHKKAESSQDDNVDSLWSHLKYGLGTAAFMGGPSLIPGVTSQQLVLGYGEILVFILLGVSVWGIVRSVNAPSGRRGG